MIIANYSTFRAMANPGGSIGADGLTEFDPTKMRAALFDDGFTLSSTSAFPIVITCNFQDADFLAGIDEFDWYVSQQTSIAANKPLTVSRKDMAPNTNSGTIEIDLAAWASAEYPDPFDLSTIPVLFFGIDIYVIRRNIFSIQRLNLASYLYDALSPKTDLE